MQALAYLHDVLRVFRHGDSPVKRGARDGQVKQRLALQARKDLVAALLRPDEVRVALDVLDETLLIPAEALLSASGRRSTQLRRRTSTA